MRCPFPGMDPYIEEPSLWWDFHGHFVTHLAEQLQPLLRPKYVAMTEQRHYVIERKRPDFPDLPLAEAAETARGKKGAPSRKQPRQPHDVTKMMRENVRERVLHIVEPRYGKRLITAIELLSPDNKTSSEGRKAYRKKVKECWRSQANLVEIDFVPRGRKMVWLSVQEVKDLRPHRYLVVVSRRFPSQYDSYPIALKDPLPRIRVPLGNGDDVVLDLQAAFSRCWETGPYPEMLSYEDPPPGRMSKEELAWCRERLEQAGYSP